MTPAVIIPAFGLDPARARALTVVRHHLAGLGWPVSCPTGGNPGQARNYGAAGLGAHYDVLVFNDADTLVPLEQIRVAASLAADGPGLVFAFTEYRRLGEMTSQRVDDVGDAFSAVPVETYQAPPSHGCVAIGRASFAELGGYDERLEVFEDLALTWKAEQRWPARRVAGPAVHLWHPRLGERGDPAWEERYAESRALWAAEYGGW